MLGKSNQNGKNEIIQLKTPVEFALEGIDKIDKHLKALDKEHKGLAIREGNKQDYEVVRLAIKDRRELRGKIVAQHKDGKKDIIAYGKSWDKEKTRIIDKIMPRETELKAEKKTEDDRIQAIKDAEAEAEENRKKAIREKIADIQRLSVDSAISTLEELDEAIEKLNGIDPDPEEYSEFTPEAMEAKADVGVVLERARANRIQLDKDEADRKAEADRLEKKREELAEQKAEQDKKEKEQAEAQKKIDDQKAAIEKEEKAKADAMMKPDPEHNEKSNHGYVSGDVSETINKRSESQVTPKTAPENGALRLDKDKIRKYVEDFKSLDIPELQNENLIAIFEAELFNLNECINILLERIE